MAHSSDNGTASVIAVLPSEYSQHRQELAENQRARILMQPVTLRSLRNAISDAILPESSVD